MNIKINEDFNCVINGTLYFFPGNAEEDKQMAENESYNLSPWYGKECEAHLGEYMDNCSIYKD